MGNGEGGIDAIYLYVNKKLVRDDTDLNQLKGQQLSIDLVIIQAKNSTSFTEGVFVKFADSTDICLRLSADLSKASKILYKQSLLNVVERFHSIYRNALSYRPTLSISFYYASLGEQIDGKVQTRADGLQAQA